VITLIRRCSGTLSIWRENSTSSRAITTTVAFTNRSAARHRLNILANLVARVLRSVPSFGKITAAVYFKRQWQSELSIRQAHLWQPEFSIRQGQRESVIGDASCGILTVTE